MSSKTVNVGHVAARLLSVELPMGLTLDEVMIEGEGLHVEKEPFLIQLKEPGSLEVRVSEASLAAFLSHKSPAGLSNFRVTLGDGLINVQATATMLISINVGAVCTLRIDGGTRLFVELQRVDAIGGPGIHNLVQKQLDAINPVVDVSDLPIGATLLKVEVANSWVHLSGTISPRAQ